METDPGKSLPGLWRFAENRVLDTLRNSYRLRFCYIYETVKLSQIELVTQFNCSESEYKFKAFIEA